MKVLLKYFFSLFILFISAISFGNAQEGIIDGKVLGNDGGLERATVSAGARTVLTNGRGEFSIGLPAGYHTLVVTYSGYKKITKEIKVDAGESLSIVLEMIPDEMMGEVVVVGSRSQEQRSNLSTPVPIDVITSRQLLQSSQPTLTQMLQFSVPSINASRPLVNEPITLRGLDPDQTLILVNNKRFHNTAFMNFGGVRGILGRGAISNDINAIPYSAIDKVEILRDGASAQYGSDAIAGVINIRLKKNTNNIWAQLHTGQFYEKDGESVSAGINRGFAFIKNGYLNFSGTFRFQNPTYRGGEYRGTVYNNFPPGSSRADSLSIVAQDDSIISARNFKRNKVSNAGSSKHNGFNISLNGGYPINKRTEVFWTGGANYRTTIFTSAYTFPKDTSRINQLLFPDGYLSRPSNHTRDIWGIAGVKGESNNNWYWEYSIVYGNNRGKYYNKNTNNPSQFYTFAKDAPTSFYTGSASYGQLTNNQQISRTILATTDRSLSLAIGTEWRYEHFQIEEGEEASWQNYNPSGTKFGGSGGLVFNRLDAIKTNRTVAAGYIDLETEYKKSYLINVATRYEYYSDFGGNMAGKLAMRYRFSEKFSVRSSVSNGFRAPSLQQRYWSFTRLGFVNGMPVTLGIFRNNSDVATAMGIPSLQAERSVNISGGFTATMFQHIRLTADAYWIQIKNRIVLTGSFTTTNNPGLRELLRNLTPVNQVQVFANAINTRTKGIDIVLNGSWRIPDADLQAILAANITRTRLYGKIKTAGNLKDDPLNSNTLFSTEEKVKLGEGQPSDKIILSLTYNPGKTILAIRNTRFGKTAIAPAYTDPVTRVTSFVHESFSGKVLTDISLGYSLKKWLTVTIGVNNMFNVYPDRLRDYRNTSEGQYVYAQEATPFGFNGGYYFLNISIKK